MKDRRTQDLADFFNQPGEVACIRLARVRGSSPREAGAVLYASQTATFGTIGGGQLEYMALDQARTVLAKQAGHAVMDVPLGPEIGQCCGGRVKIEIRQMSQADKKAALARFRVLERSYPQVLIFGAGHVGRALARVLALLPLRFVVIDSRAQELSLCDADLEKQLSLLPESLVRKAPPNSAFVVLTHDHSLDFLIVAEALARGDAAYVGMIGSETKRAAFENWCKTHQAPVNTAPLICPIGRSQNGDKRPEVIAGFVAAEVMERLLCPERSKPKTGKDAALSDQ